MAVKKHDDDFMTGINITPFTDVVLVLLIIFMVAAPYIQKDTLPVNLPKVSAENRQESKTPDEARELVVLNSKNIVFDGKTLETELSKDIFKNGLIKNTDEIIAVSADAAASYQDVVKVLDILRKIEIKNVILRTEF